MIPQNVDLLEALVIHLATLYDQGEDCVDFDGEEVSNPEYDALVRELRNKRPDSRAFDKNSTSPSVYVPTGNLVVHNPPMTSIAKADGVHKEDIYKDWISQCCKTLGYEDPPKPFRFSQSLKHDGVATRIYYEKGKLVKAGLRPKNGVNGIDITANVQYVTGIPQSLPQPWTMAIAGELECLLSDFKLVQAERAAAGEDPRKNPRNHTYGSINQHKDPSKTKDGKLSFMAYAILNFDQAADFYKTEVERAKWCNQTLKIPYVRTSLHDFEDLAEMEAKVPDLPYEVDGVVLKVNNLEDQEQLGNSGDTPTGDPRGALAWKFAEEEATAETSQLVWRANRTGRVTPVVVFTKGVYLAGTIVSRATCSNYGWLTRAGIGAGTVVTVIKAGKIIPKVIKVISGKVDKIDYPKDCPSCNNALDIIDGHGINKELMCLNQLCPAKQIRGFVFYLTNIDAKGIGDSVMEQILESGKVHSRADLYTLSVDDLCACQFSEREALLVLATIHMVKPVKNNDKLLANITAARAKKKIVPGWQFFAALGISGAGKTYGKDLFEHFGNFDKIMNASVEELIEVEGIGKITAESIRNYFAAHKPEVLELLQHIELELPKTGGILDGVTFVLSGSFDDGKSHWEKRIQDAGGKCGSSVSAKTQYLVAGPGAGSKLERAKELEVKVIDVKELEKMLA